MEISQLFPRSQNNVNLGSALREVGRNGEVLVSKPYGVTVDAITAGGKTGAENGTYRRISVTRGWVGRVVHTLKYYFGVSYREKVEYSRQTVLAEMLKACKTLESHIKDQPGENIGESDDLVNLENIRKEIVEITKDDKNYSRGSFYRARVARFIGAISEISGRAGEYREPGSPVKLTRRVFRDAPGTDSDDTTGRQAVVGPDAGSTSVKSLGSSATRDS